VLPSRVKLACQIAANEKAGYRAFRINATKGLEQLH
jgi:hypothetical protein